MPIRNTTSERFRAPNVPLGAGIGTVAQAKRNLSAIAANSNDGWILTRGRRLGRGGHSNGIDVKSGIPTVALTGYTNSGNLLFYSN